MYVYIFQSIWANYNNYNTNIKKIFSHGVGQAKYYVKI